MKHAVIVVIASVFLVFPAVAPVPEQSFILRGIVWITDPALPPIKLASFKSPPPYQGGLLSEGDREGMLSVQSILPESGKVIIKDEARQQTIKLQLPDRVGPRVEAPTFDFASVTIGHIVDLLQMLSGRTIIAPASILGEGISLTTPALRSRSEARAALEEVLRTNDLILTVRGEKFAFLMPLDSPEVVSSIPNPPSSEQLTNGAIPAGLIKFNDADVAQALDVYQMLRGRTVIYPGNIRAKVAVRTQTRVERDEAVWLMNAMLRLAGLVVVPEADKFVFAVPPSMTNSLPHFERKAALAKAAITNDGAAAPIRLSGADPQQMLDMAAVTMGRIPIPILPPIEVPRFETYNLRTEPLDQAESIFALEAWAHLNGFAFELVGSDKVAITQRAPEQP